MTQAVPKQFLTKVANEIMEEIKRDTTVSALCRKLRITPVTLYRYVGSQGQLREQGKKVLAPRIGARQRGRVGVRTSCDRPRGGLLWAARVSAVSCILSFRILPVAWRCCRNLTPSPTLSLLTG